MNRKCKQCKNSFPIKRINQYYCSQSCRQKAYLLRNGFSHEKEANSDVNPNNLLQNITDSLNPELLQGILSLVSDNPSLTDYFKKTNEKTNETKESYAPAPDKNVNDAKANKGKIMQDFCRKRKEFSAIKREKSAFMKENNVVMEEKSAIVAKNSVIMPQKSAAVEDSCGKYEGSMGVSWSNHAGGVSKRCESHVNSMGVMYDNPSKDTGSNTFSKMISEKMTISIGKNGFVKNLFPHWPDKEWEYSLCINQELVEVLDVLYSASQKNRIKTNVLSDCQKTLKSISTGVQSFFLPKDYPFMRFIRYLKSKVTEVIDKISDQKEIKFRLSEELREQMFILKLQLKE